MLVNINTEELHDILEMTPAEQNIMLAGRHGIGKSQILTHYFRDKGLPVITLFLGQMSDPGDLIGLPCKNEKTGKTDFLPPYWFPSDGKPIVLFLDELNRARPEVLQSVMDLTLNRTLAGKRLPEGSRIISAVNTGDEYQLTDLDPALVSRFNIYQFRPSVSEWLSWAESNGIDKRIIDFIEHNQQYLDVSLRADADNLDKSPDRRAWERISNVLKNNPEINNTLKKSIAGILGAEAANLFFTSINKNRKINGKALLEDFDNCKKGLEAYKLTDLSMVNEMLLRQLEQDQPKGKTVKLWAENAAKYISWLVVEQPIREAAAHLAESLLRGQYPKAGAFILSNKPDVYQTLATFILKL